MVHLNADGLEKQQCHTAECCMLLVCTILTDSLPLELGPLNTAREVVTNPNANPNPDPEWQRAMRCSVRGPTETAVLMTMFSNHQG